jgi:hypothetical protein
MNSLPVVFALAGLLIARQRGIGHETNDQQDHAPPKAIALFDLLDHPILIVVMRCAAEE